MRFIALFFITVLLTSCADNLVSKNCRCECSHKEKNSKVLKIKLPEKNFLNDDENIQTILGDR